MHPFRDGIAKDQVLRWRNLHLGSNVGSSGNKTLSFVRLYMFCSVLFVTCNDVLYLRDARSGNLECLNLPKRMREVKEESTTKYVIKKYKFIFP